MSVTSNLPAVVVGDLVVQGSLVVGDLVVQGSLGMGGLFVGEAVVRKMV